MFPHKQKSLTFSVQHSGGRRKDWKVQYMAWGVYKKMSLGDLVLQHPLQESSPNNSAIHAPIEHVPPSHAFVHWKTKQ